MRISETYESIDHAVPEPALVLLSMENVSMYHEKWGARNPIASYTVSISSVAMRVRTVLELHQAAHIRLCEDPTQYDWNPLLEATDNMLDSLMEHMEDCEKLIKLFFEHSTDPHYLKLLRDYKKSVRFYRDFIGKSVNFVKHHQGRFRALAFTWPNSAAIGYFIEGTGIDGVNGPSAIVHPDENSAFSYNRDIPLHICNVFANGLELSTVLRQISPDERSAGLPVVSTPPDTNWKRVLQLAAELPLIFFPDEIVKLTPQITIEDNSHVSISLTSPTGEEEVPTQSEKLRVQISYTGDSVTKRFKLPYYRQQ